MMVLPTASELYAATLLTMAEGPFEMQESKCSQLPVEDVSLLVCWLPDDS